MRRAIPAIAASAAGLAWLLHAQGIIDSSGATVAAGPAGGSGSPSSTSGKSNVPTTTTTTTRSRGGFEGDDDGPIQAPNTTTTTSRSAPTTTTAPSGGSSGDKTVSGPTVDTRWGPVQVQVVISGGRLTDVKALQYPTHASRSAYISQQALPWLHDEAISAQSSNIDTISGATYTSDGYSQSLQAALDQAGFKG